MQMRQQMMKIIPENDASQMTSNLEKTGGANSTVADVLHMQCIPIRRVAQSEPAAWSSRSFPSCQTKPTDRNELDIALASYCAIA